ncbi:unnamed protein product [Ranitomeya imitator]|uniref:Protein kinase domain-containing protein n=1 Tax=Ranitomeya imitator TaxID=111125 RepID=A0ABN9MF21_9NEOB|nr:unnamed protein product [Ranitomeya imitator]
MGIILHEFLLGSIPFDGDTVNELFKTVLFDHSHINKHLVSEDEEGTSENNDGFDFENYTSSSEKHCKLCTTTTSMVNVEDPKTHPECTAASNSDIAEMQKESVSVSDRDDAITILPFSPSLSGYRYTIRFSNDHDQRYDLAVIVAFVSVGEGRCLTNYSIAHT